MFGRWEDIGQESIVWTVEITLLGHEAVNEAKLFDDIVGPSHIQVVRQSTMNPKAVRDVTCIAE